MGMDMMGGMPPMDGQDMGGMDPNQPQMPPMGDDSMGADMEGGAQQKTGNKELDDLISIASQAGQDQLKALVNYAKSTIGDESEEQQPEAEMPMPQEGQEPMGQEPMPSDGSQPQMPPQGGGQQQMPQM